MRSFRILGVILLAMLAVGVTPAFGATTLDPIDVGTGDLVAGAPIPVKLSGSTTGPSNVFLNVWWGDEACTGDLNIYAVMSPIPAGRFTATVDQTINTSGTWTLCAYLSDDIRYGYGAVQRRVVTVRAAVRTIDSLGAGADFVEDITTPLIVRGSTEAKERLFVTRFNWDTECSLHPYAHEQLVVPDPDMSPGAFSRTIAFTPDNAARYTLCAYLGTRLVRRDVVTVRRTNDTIDAITVSPEPEEDAPVTITVTGSAEVARTLIVDRGRMCEAFFGPREPSSSEVRVRVGPGPYSYSFQRTLGFGSSEQVCAHIENPDGDQSESGVRANLVKTLVREHPASIDAIDVAGAAHVGAPLQVTVTGTSDAQRVLLVPTSTSGDCLGPANISSTVDAVGPGPFSITRTITPQAAGALTVCAIVAAGPTFRQVATRQVSVNVAPAPAPAPPKVVARIAVKFALRGPAAKASVVGGRPTFKWADIAGVRAATKVTVSRSNRRVATTGALKAPVFSLIRCARPATCVAKAAQTARPTRALPPGTYYWTVSWKDPGTGKVGSTEVRRFVVPVAR